MEIFVGWFWVAVIVAFCVFVSVALVRLLSHVREVSAQAATANWRLQLVMSELNVREPQPEFPQVLAALRRGDKATAVVAYQAATRVDVPVGDCTVDVATARRAVEEIARTYGL